MQSPIISPGGADLLLGLEALEAFRALDRGHKRRLVIAHNASAFRLGGGGPGFPELVPLPPCLTLSGNPDIRWEKDCHDRWFWSAPLRPKPTFINCKAWKIL